MTFSLKAIHPSLEGHALKGPPIAFVRVASYMVDKDNHIIISADQCSLDEFKAEIDRLHSELDQTLNEARGVFAQYSSVS